MKVLIIGTTYEANQERARLHDLWVKLHSYLNPSCDLLLVDSASPWRPSLAERHPNFLSHPAKYMLYVFPDNLGHFDHPPAGGRDGWGRALSFGLQFAMDFHYDYVVHIEGDSLCRLNFLKIARQMQKENIEVASTSVFIDQSNFVESGLMFFSVPYLQTSNFIARYNWAARTRHPYTEEVLFQIFGSSLKWMPWKTRRCDDRKMPFDLVPYLDWITKCHDFSYYEYFFEVNYKPGKWYEYN
jgi:hypothetical protein